jgi:DNA-binding response OmpR family regulator
LVEAIMQPPRVLVVDDDEDMRALVAGTLRAEGFEVVEAADGEAALDLLDAVVENPLVCPDVVITDVKMPKFSGFGLLSALRRAQVQLPVILMTVLADQSVTTLAKRLGAAEVLHKPLLADDLRRAVKKLRVLRGRVPVDSVRPTTSGGSPPPVAPRPLR